MKIKESTNKTASEEIVLGAMLLDPTAIPDVMANIATKEVFSTDLHQKIFETIRCRYNKGDKIDMYSIASASSEFKDKIAYIGDLPSKAGSGANCNIHVKILIESYLKRKLWSYGSLLMGKSSSDEDVFDLIGWSQKQIDDIANVTTKEKAARSIGAVLEESMHEAEARSITYKNGYAVGVPTGLTDLDNATGGWKGGAIDNCCRSSSDG